MSTYPIDLGKSMDLGPTEAAKEPTKEYYPSLYLDWDSDYQLPDEGEMTVHFKKRSQTTRKEKDKTKQTVELDIVEILDVESTGAEAEEESGGKALDRYRSGSK